MLFTIWVPSQQNENTLIKCYYRNKRERATGFPQMACTHERTFDADRLCGLRWLGLIGVGEVELHCGIFVDELPCLRT